MDDDSDAYNKAKDILTTDEAMAVLGMSKPTILKKMKYEKTLPYTGEGGRHGYRLNKKDVAEYAKRNHIKAKWKKVVEKEVEQPQHLATNTAIQSDFKTVLEKIAKNPAILDSLIKLVKTQQKQAELKLQELELEDDSVKNTKEYKLKILKIKMEINKLDETLLQYDILKQSTFNSFEEFDKMVNEDSYQLVK